jgi:hypothetical protein
MRPGSSNTKASTVSLTVRTGGVEAGRRLWLNNSLPANRRSFVMRFLAETEHLRVFESPDFAIGEFYPRRRRLYVGFPKDDATVHTPMPMITALVELGEPLDPADSRHLPFFDWLETARWLEDGCGVDIHAPQGVRDEFMAVVIAQVPDLSADGEEVEWPDGTVHYRNTAVAIDADEDDYETALTDTGYQGLR